MEIPLGDAEGVLGTKHGVERDTKVVGEAGNKQMRAGWISMGAVPR